MRKFEKKNCNCVFKKYYAICSVNKEKYKNCENLPLNYTIDCNKSSIKL